MSEYTPQTNYFILANKLNKLENALFIISFILSIFLTIFFKESIITNILSIVFLVALTVSSFAQTYFQNKGEYKRRLDFIDNSFGTKFTIDQSRGYFSNSNIKIGLRKALANVFENLFFSLNISNEMKKKSLIKMLIGGSIIFGFSMYGFAKSSLALPILQLFISKYFIEEFILLNNYTRTLEDIEKDIINILESYDALDYIKLEANVIKVLVSYECNISFSKILLDSKIFNKYNESLSEEWIGVKNKYNL